MIMTAAATVAQKTGVIPAFEAALISMCGTIPAQRTLPRVWTNSHVLNPEKATTLRMNRTKFTRDWDNLLRKNAGTSHTAHTKPRQKMGRAAGWERVLQKG